MFYAAGPTPLLNSLKVPFRFPLQRDSQGRLIEIEMIAYPGTLFSPIKEHADNMMEVKTKEYPANVYVDGRFLKPVASEKERTLPSLSEVLKTLESLKGIRYFWGGNWPEGIPSLLDLYPPHQHLDTETRLDWTCTGLDCSGLLFYATNGKLPRNTSELYNYGKSVTQLQPGDLIVKKGHVIIVLNEETAIESILGRGVVTSPLKKRLQEISSEPYIFRRWHPQLL